MLRVSLGEVCHSQIHYVMRDEGRADHGSTCPDSGIVRRAGPIFTAQIPVLHPVPKASCHVLFGVLATLHEWTTLGG